MLKDLCSGITKLGRPSEEIICQVSSNFTGQCVKTIYLQEKISSLHAFLCNKPPKKLKFNSEIRNFFIDIKNSCSK